MLNHKRPSLRSSPETTRPRRHIANAAFQSFLSPPFLSAFNEKQPKMIITRKSFDSVTLSFDHFAPDGYPHGYVAMVRSAPINHWALCKLAEINELCASRTFPVQGEGWRSVAQQGAGQALGSFRCRLRPALDHHQRAKPQYRVLGAHRYIQRLREQESREVYRRDRLHHRS